ncbi:hypothetical protein JXA27_06475 [Aerococcaceae bacterium zg-B36]|uniref:hypothetical protein n=1 Tax=Aerococcaceae bacterium zg-252 TaxID=2796928 RepID=UPI001BD8DF86|nr:hypothetical protein [Aerococcaceae bacterium zg-B36]
MKGDTRRYGSKGYESLPRELLQNSELSLESIGLLCFMLSRPEDWVWYKTELYTCFKKNKRSQITRMWDELVEFNYIIQFRKRVGKKFQYMYWFDEKPFGEDEIVDVFEKMQKDGFEFYHKDVSDLADINKIVDIIGIHTETFKEKVHKIWTAENQHSKKDVQNFSTADFQQSNLNSPKPTSIKYNIKQITNKQIDDDDISNSMLEMFDMLCRMNKLILDMSKYLFNCGVDILEITKIAMALDGRDELLNPRLIVKQQEWCVIKMQDGKIGDYAKYFVGGLERLHAYGQYNMATDSEFYSSAIGQSIEQFELPVLDF